MTSLFVVLVLAADAGVTAPALDRRTRELMHTEVSLALPSSVPVDVREAAFGEAFAVFEDIEANLNEWKSDSPLAKVNASEGKPVDAPKTVCSVVSLALDGAKRTKGLFDPTWAALREVWKFGSAEDGAVPAYKEVQAKCALVGWAKVRVSPHPDGSCAITLQKGMRLGLGGVVKGWGVDQVVSLFRARGLKDFFVQAGGDLYVGGLVEGRKWRVGIRDPRGPKTQSFAKVELSDAAFSTSGDYEHFFVKDGVRYHHLIDLRTCQPARASVSATVLAKSATDAEFLTKAAFILGPKEGQPLVRTFGAAAVWVTPDGKVHATEGLEKELIDVWAPSGLPGP
ncbi:MAG: FAD:protein FMN transferase [Myxococcaceae bacterium]